MSDLNKVQRGKHILRNENYSDELRERLVNNSVMGYPGKNDCWLWVRRHQRNGYGAVRAFGKMMPAHRASFLVFKGPIPSGKEVGHSCHERSCVNPDHLDAITHAENMSQMRKRKRGMSDES